MKWLNLTDAERRDTIAVVAEERGLTVNAVEKDWWVSVVLRAIFSTEYRPHLLFKGGTSLSKGWDLIKRLSEDIDLALNRELLGYGGELSTGKIDKLRNDSEDFVAKKLGAALQAELEKSGISPAKFTITQDKEEKSDPHLMINYPSLYEPLPYLPPRVKIEVSTRSMMEPWSNRSIQSFIGAHYADQDFADAAFDVPTVEPRRTFLEKAFLMHEEFLREEGKIKVTRMSRHLFDLEKLMDTEHGVAALSDMALYQEIVEHRSVFYKRGHVDYKTHDPATVDFIPPAHAREAFRGDYATMQENMIYGESLAFDALIERLQFLLTRFRGNAGK